jgi:Protein of unknown function (DUF2950)
MKTRKLLITALFCSLATLTLAQSKTTAAASKAPDQTTFATPQAAADALIKATADYDTATLLQIFGPDGKDFVESADEVQDKNRAESFAELAKEKMEVKLDVSDPNVARIVVGDNDWPFPVPVVKKNGSWRFNSKAGRTEILYRRIGSNELDAIQVCRGYVYAQHEYAETVHDNSGINQYAQKIISTPGQRDGLYWQNADGTSGGPIGEAVAKAIEEGYSNKREPYHGYYFKILKGQGPAAPNGAIDYVIQGVMIGGFALIAAPAEYRVTGVKTFIINQDGIVYEKDLGPNTLELAKKIELYNPDKTWKVTDDQWPESVDVADAGTQ